MRRHQRHHRGWVLHTFPMGRRSLRRGLQRPLPHHPAAANAGPGPGHHGRCAGGDPLRAGRFGRRRVRPHRPIDPGRRCRQSFRCRPLRSARRGHRVHCRRGGHRVGRRLPGIRRGRRRFGVRAVPQLLQRRQRHRLPVLPEQAPPGSGEQHAECRGVPERRHPVRGGISQQARPAQRPRPIARGRDGVPGRESAAGHAEHGGPRQQRRRSLLSGGHVLSRRWSSGAEQGVGECDCSERWSGSDGCFHEGVHL
mmetsp:Transcript_29110/g.84615  ORF Transcript_29110/g.84615 Transcript_29110/m.84615 type:complete len:253 (-) Transcript_29110:686-1444(-)